MMIFLTFLLIITSVQGQDTDEGTSAVPIDCNQAKQFGPENIAYNPASGVYQGFQGNSYVESSYVDGFRLMPTSGSKSAAWESKSDEPVTAVIKHQAPRIFFRGVHICEGEPEVCKDTRPMIWATATPDIEIDSIIAAESYGVFDDEHANFTVLIATGTKKCDKNASREDCGKKVAIHSVFEEGYKLSQAVTNYSTVSLAPTAVVFRRNTKTYDALLIYGPIWTVNHAGESSMPWKPPTQHRLWSSNTWLGCPVELCIEPTLDAATKIDGLLHLHRDRWSWVINGDPERDVPEASRLKVGQNTLEIDASSGLDDEHSTIIVFKGSDYLLTDVNGM